jgi:hypothetical protein
MTRFSGADRLERCCLAAMVGKALSVAMKKSSRVAMSRSLGMATRLSPLVAK